MRFATESIALSAALIALPALAAPVPGQSITSSTESVTQTGPGTAHHGLLPLDIQKDVSKIPITMMGNAPIVQDRMVRIPLRNGVESDTIIRRSRLGSFTKGLNEASDVANAGSNFIQAGTGLFENADQMMNSMNNN